MKGRNGLAKATSADELLELISELRTIWPATLDGMYLDRRGSLVPLGWDRDRIDLYLHVSRLPYMARRTLELYTDLLSDLQSTANSPSGGWVVAKRGFGLVRPSVLAYQDGGSHSVADDRADECISSRCVRIRFRIPEAARIPLQTHDVPFTSHSLTVSTAHVAPRRLQDSLCAAMAVTTLSTLEAFGSVSGEIYPQT
jgi:hypothetical protein